MCFNSAGGTYICNNTSTLSVREWWHKGVAGESGEPTVPVEVAVTETRSVDAADAGLTEGNPIPTTRSRGEAEGGMAPLEEEG